MRVGLDVRPCFKVSSRRRGLGKTARRLTRELLSLPEAHDYVLFLQSGAVAGWKGSFEVRRIPGLRRPERLNWLTDRLLLPSRVRRAGLDLFHAGEITSIPTGAGVPVWATVYDLIPLVFWNETRRRTPWDFRQALRLAFGRVARADRVVTCSQHSKNDLCRRLGVQESRIEVVPLACDESFRPIERGEARETLLRRHQLEGPFLLYVGGTDFRKNLPMLVRAFSEIRRRGYPGKLALVGETFLWDIEEVREFRREVARLDLESAVVFPGYVEDEDLPFFYSACDFFVFPSRYEGFGLPVLEALQCGAPTLAARSSSIPEVAGEAVVYFDPDDEASLVAAFESCHGDEVRLRQLRGAGLERARRFSWKESALRLHRLYAEAGARR